MSAQIVYQQGNSTFDCTVRNISSAGALISTDRPLALPPSFLLRFQDGTKRPVELVWTKATLIGVRFVDVEQPVQKAAEANIGDDVKAGLLARLADIERQLAELRAQIIVLRD